MNYEEVLLIGGPKDGARISVMEGVPSIRVCVMSDTAVHIGGNADYAQTTVDAVEYRRITMSGDKGFKGCVYVTDGIEPISALIDGYRKP
ncbi:hypothetical protein [Pseudomonas protegens]|uniref:hypothetical protein n=1 Tax=Pseudomonas protegens TaxID=380021 RepID=UPI000AF41D13|nr:hypothetical protein [Pseudomonas protegens]